MARCVHFDVCYPVCLRKHISKAEVIHREALIGRNNALGRNRQLKLLLLYLDVESLPLQEAFCFHGIEVICCNIYSVRKVRSNSYYILRRIFLSVLSNQLVLCALILRRHTFFINVLQGRDDILFFNLRNSHPEPPSLFLFVR